MFLSVFNPFTLLHLQLVFKPKAFCSLFPCDLVNCLNLKTL